MGNVSSIALIWKNRKIIVPENPTGRDNQLITKTKIDAWLLFEANLADRTVFVFCREVGPGALCDQRHSGL